MNWPPPIPTQKGLDRKGLKLLDLQKMWLFDGCLIRRLIAPSRLDNASSPSPLANILQHPGSGAGANGCRPPPEGPLNPLCRAGPRYDIASSYLGTQLGFRLLFWRALGALVF